MADMVMLKELASRIRQDILSSSTEAGSGHPTSSLSAVELMAALLFGGFFRYDPREPKHPNNDRLIFSKGHASPLFYALWAAAGEVSEEELLTYRRFGSPLEGHPTTAFRFTEAATGSLGQGLSIGVGMALNGKRLDHLPYRTFVLLGDSEMTEGSQWEAIQLAAHYGLDNLVGIIDVNRLGQRGETMYGHDIRAYAKRVAAFGWEAIPVEDGHDFEQVLSAYARATSVTGRPVMIVARTIKGKGVPMLEDKNGWHGIPLSREQSDQAMQALGAGAAAKRIIGRMEKPENLRPEQTAPSEPGSPAYDRGSTVATRDAYGKALKRLAPAYPNLVVLDAEVSNSTRAEYFKEAHPERFLEMYIAEQNMVGAATGLAARGKLPFVSTFAAFLMRACDQIRMARYSDANIKLCGSHAGVSIGEDGLSQMGLEDLAFFRAVPDCAVLYPSDAVSTERLVEEAARRVGMVYLRTTRGKTPVIYDSTERFPLGGSKTLRQSEQDRATLVAAGITLHEALAAADDLLKEGIRLRVIDLYSVKPIDSDTLARAAEETGIVVTVEDHYAQGGLGEAVMAVLSGKDCRVHALAVRKRPRSGKPEELLVLEGIDRKGITETVRALLG
ncbi:transketolase [Desulfocurvibacter africanus]|uniref:transketolase n=1 Tax=Desulfocurvibacter africanus TaxID=873 RepID=UPI002FD8C78F